MNTLKLNSLIKKILKYVFLPILGIAILWATYFLLLGNFHKVDNEMYRSAQLFSHNMSYYTDKHNIKSILNFRGKKNKKFWRDEISYAKEHNITHYDYHISDRKIQTLQTMNEIVQIIKDAPKPLLIHCKAGADRTSLVAALYLHAIKNDEDASKAISIIYGHFPWLGSRTVAMDKSFELYKKNHPINK